MIITILHFLKAKLRLINTLTLKVKFTECLTMIYNHHGVYQGGSSWHVQCSGSCSGIVWPRQSSGNTGKWQCQLQLLLPEVSSLYQLHGTTLHQNCQFCRNIWEQIGCKSKSIESIEKYRSTLILLFGNFKYNFSLGYHLHLHLVDCGSLQSL